MKKERTRFYFFYTVLFIFFALMVFSAFFLRDKSLVWEKDGLYQHYNAFVYYGEWLRGIVHTLVCEHRLEIPLWEFSIGYGADVIHTLTYYVIGDPFALLSAFTPEAYAEIGYDAAILLRFYAAGIAFCAYLRKMGAENFAALTASMMYLFCSYSFVAFRHPYFIDPMIYLPLVFLGVEKLLKRERPFCYIISVFFAAVSNFYFFYMIVLLTILYVALRLLCDREMCHWKTLFQMLGKFGGFAAVGVMMAAVLFLPVVMNFLTDQRVSAAYQFNLFYSRKEYETLLGSLVGLSEAGTWCYAGAVPLAFLGAGAVLLERGRKYLWLKLFLAMLLLFMLLPVAGYVFNGFGYVTNRWIFAWPLAVNLCFALGWPMLLQMDKKRKRILAGVVAGYIFMCMALPKARQPDVLFGCAFLAAFLFLICFHGRIGKLLRKYAPSCQKIGFQAVMFGMAAVCIFGQSRERYVRKGYAEKFVDRGMAAARLNRERAGVWDEIEDDSFYRIDNTMLKNKQSDFALNSGQSTTTLFWSLVNPSIVEYLQANNAYRAQIYNLRGLSSRSYLLPLASAKYYVTGDRKVQQESVPYPFQPLRTGDPSCVVYKSDAVLPFGYTFERVLSAEDFKKLPVAKRQQVMLQGAVMQPEDLEAVSSLSVAEPDYTDRELPFMLECGKGAALSGNVITTTKKHAKVTLKFQCPKNCELYVLFQGLSFENTCPYSDSGPFSQKAYWTPVSETEIVAKCKKKETNVICFTPYNLYVHGREDYLLNLYYCDSGRARATITFEERGVYAFDDLTLIAQPMDGLKGQVDALRQDTLQNVVMSANSIAGDITLGQDKLLCLSLPYAKGWHAYVDGEKTELLRTNLMYSGVMLSAGRHRIELHYRTPYLTAGWMISLFGFGILLFIWLYDRKEREGCDREVDYTESIYK